MSFSQALSCRTGGAEWHGVARRAFTRLGLASAANLHAGNAARAPSWVFAALYPSKRACGTARTNQNGLRHA